MRDNSETMKYLVWWSHRWFARNNIRGCFVEASLAAKLTDWERFLWTGQNFVTWLVFRLASWCRHCFRRWSAQRFACSSHHSVGWHNAGKLVGPQWWTLHFGRRRFELTSRRWLYSPWHHRHRHWRHRLPVGRFHRLVIDAALAYTIRTSGTAFIISRSRRNWPCTRNKTGVSNIKSIENEKTYFQILST